MRTADTYTFARTAMLASTAAVLSVIEDMLPELPVPGARLGLANLPVMTAVSTMGLGSGLCVALFKAFIALITRGPVAGAMSLSGSVLSTLVMWAVISFDRNKLGFVGIGVLGAVSHNMGQFAVSLFIIGAAVDFYLPYLIIMAVFTGAFIGFVNSIIVPVLFRANKKYLKNKGEQR